MKKLDQIVKGLNKTEARDKISKMIQYGTRFLTWYYQKLNKLEKADQFNNLFSMNKYQIISGNERSSKDFQISQNFE
ncbi:unnamed protein product [Paramecium sonneborni]|uniref:Uncharacterized protein n=1 Tax=Paramecium sonneborni TaxID=65129 RepID=A0A8S1QIS1_9CILI|nr:unnamed protein product [Paramecium sonneborni]